MTLTHKIATKRFIVDFQKYSLPKSDTGKGVNLHIFRMASIETFNVPSTVYGRFYTL